MKKIAVIGAGAAGFFGAIAAAEKAKDTQVLLLEKSMKILSKVKISGGGRCNVTHNCFDIKELVKNYPRGHKELLGPFSRFQPRDTIEWFESRGVPLKTENDGRMFPITDSSETIIACLREEALKAGVQLLLKYPVRQIIPLNPGWKINDSLEVDKLLIATGSSPEIWRLLAELGHTVIPPVPSLFTFNTPDSSLLDLAGISVPRARVMLPELDLEQLGPLLLTHWGFSGPAVLKLSAWAARELHHVQYDTILRIQWLPDYTHERLNEALRKIKSSEGQKNIQNYCPFDLPKNLWKRFTLLTGIEYEQKWSMLTKSQIEDLIMQLCALEYRIKGTTTNKEEFVTCGGVALQEVNFKSMESKKHPGLFFAGEVLDLDGVTGGFNFQNAWTTGWIAGQAIAL